MCVLSFFGLMTMSDERLEASKWNLVWKQAISMSTSVSKTKYYCTSNNTNMTMVHSLKSIFHVRK